MRNSLRLTTALALYLSKAYPLAHEILARAEALHDPKQEKREHLIEDKIERSLGTLMKTRGFHRYRKVSDTTLADISFQHYRIEGELDSHQVWEEEAWIEVSPESGLGRMFALVSVPIKDGPRNWYLYERARWNEGVIKQFGPDTPDSYQVAEDIERYLTEAAKSYHPSKYESVIGKVDQRLRDVEQSIRELEARPPSMSPMDVVGDGTAFLATRLIAMVWTWDGGDAEGVWGSGERPPRKPRSKQIF